jgi:hypothetical protein
MKLRAGIGGVAAALLLLHVPAHAQEAPTAPPPAASRPSIPYKQGNDIGASLGRVGVGLVIALGVGVAALAAYKRMVLTPAAGRRMRLVETLRLGPKIAIFLVEVDGRTLLIGQHGETLAVLDPSQRAA